MVPMVSNTPICIHILDSESERIACDTNKECEPTVTDRIQGGYGSVADKHFVGPLFKIKIGLTSGVKLACKNYSTNR
jgi:hypothetical protein